MVNVRQRNLHVHYRTRTSPAQQRVSVTGGKLVKVTHPGEPVPGQALSCNGSLTSATWQSELRYNKRTALRAGYNGGDTWHK